MGSMFNSMKSRALISNGASDHVANIEIQERALRRGPIANFTNVGFAQEVNANWQRPHVKVLNNCSACEAGVSPGA